MVLVSFYFYGYWNPTYLLLISASIAVNYLLGLNLRRSREQATAAPMLGGHSLPGHRQLYVTVGICFNLGLLCYFKYAGFLTSNLAAVLGAEMIVLDIVLPLAISFFTFQQIAYLVDSYRCKVQEYDFLNYCLFVTFFPQLIAGPIVHHAEMMPQFLEIRSRVVDWDNVARGTFVFTIGLFKKVVVADSFAVYANAGFANFHSVGFYDAWIASLSYTFQIYYDFSGYTDMAIGAALLFNIRLPINFDSPYQARSLQDFWQRWHMTLSRWLRDYLYIPLGGNRMVESRVLCNVFVTFLIGGLWHGAGWTFVVWGGLHGGAVIAEKLWQKLGLTLPSLVSWALTFLFVNFAWLFFRAQSIDQAVTMLSRMLCIPGQFSLTEPFATTVAHKQWLLGNLFGTPHTDLAGSLLLVLFGCACFVIRESLDLSELYLRNGSISFPKATLTGVLVAVLFFVATSTFTGGTSPSEFLYFNF